MFSRYADYARLPMLTGSSIGVAHMSKLKPVFKCPDNFKDEFKQSTCLLTISVGQEVHEGEHFQTTIKLVNSAFKSCIMLIDDSLQRHTMALNSANNAESFYQASIEAGNQWLERNKRYCEQLSILDKVIRWDHWLFHPDFKVQQQKIKSLKESDSSYQDAFNHTVNEFLDRYYRRLQDSDNFNLERAKQLCHDYLTEECTALCLWPELNCQFEVYPSPRNYVMDQTHKRFVIPTYANLLYAVSIKFKNRKQLKPQVLQT